MIEFSSCVGSDYNIRGPALGKFGSRKVNANGELLLGMSCAELDLVITNTYFKVPYFKWIRIASLKS